MKEHLLHFFPFLRTDFRKLEESELQSEETFKELFPNDAVELWKLRTIYVYQNSNKINEALTKKELQKINLVMETAKVILNPKPLKNAKV